MGNKEVSTYTTKNINKPTKAIYKKPALWIFGSVKTLTTGSGGTMVDGGPMPHKF
jgi:hypothetical protein